MHGDLNWHLNLRQYICQHICEQWELYRERVALFHNYPFDITTYWQRMATGHDFATGLEIQAAAELLNLQFVVWVKGQKLNKVTQLPEVSYRLEIINGQTGNEQATIVLLLHNLHYNLLKETISANKIYASLDNEENQMFLQARKVGTKYVFPVNKESKKEKNARISINQKCIQKQLQNCKLENTEHLPDPPPLVKDPNCNHALDAIRAFECEQMAYSFNSCSVCHERRLEMKMASKSTCICQRCHKDKGPVKMFSKENNMDPGVLPDELKSLTLVEQQLICKISPCINVHMLNHGGIAANGHCVSFPQAVDEPAQIFPKLPEEINIIKVKRHGRNDTSKEFTVRRYTVQTALYWLKQHNPAYFDIIISQDRLNRLPVNGELTLHTVKCGDNPTKHTPKDKGPAPAQTHLENTNDYLETNSGVLLSDPPVDIRKTVSDVVQNVTGQTDVEVSANNRGVLTIPWPTRENSPVSEFVTRNFFTMAFPCLFPYGSGDFHVNRKQTCTSMADWAEHLLWYEDGRFARHPYFKFIVHNMIMRRRSLECANFVFRQKLGDEHLTVSDLRERLQNNDQSMAKTILYFGASLRGTAQYWTQRSRELRSLIQYQINLRNGLPSLFTTGSCAEYHFKPLRQLLHQYIYDTTGEKKDLQNRSTLFTSLQQNTHVVAHYFDLRTKSYFEKVMKPVFGIDTYWYRQEFAKSRGMVHWHGLCWRTDKEPHQLMYDALCKGLSDDVCAESLSDWAKANFGMTACHPAGKHPDGTPRRECWPPPEGTAPAPPEETNPC